MRISRSIAGIMVLAASLLFSGAALAGDPYASPVAAYEFGIRTYRAGKVDEALPALDYASRNGVFLATYYLARIYSSNGSGHVDHAEAFRLYQQIVTNYGQVDPFLNYRAPFVARSYVALALYWRAGVADAGIAPDPARADKYLLTAANIFDNDDAQFELAKSYLDVGADENLVRSGVHWLTTLAENKAHAGAQAYLADLFWRGRHVTQSQATALVLATLAMENAAEEDRIWIEALYHEIYCRTSQPSREKALISVAEWHDSRAKFLAEPEIGSADAAAPASTMPGGVVTEIGDQGPALACEDGEILQMPKSQNAQNKRFMGKSEMGLGLKSLGAEDAGEPAILPGFAPAEGQQ